MITKICFGNTLKADICENGIHVVNSPEESGWTPSAMLGSWIICIYVGCRLRRRSMVEGCDNILGLLGCSANSMRNMF